MLETQTTSSPEKNLLLAVLRRALFDYVNGGGTERTAAREWLFEEDPNSSFTFRWICSELNIEPTSILMRLRSRPRQRTPGYVSLVAEA